MQRRVNAEQVTGMDECIHGLTHALALACDRYPNITVTEIAFLESEVEAITEHWARIRGPLPPSDYDTGEAR